jgi:ribosome-dependent ATPase
VGGFRAAIYKEFIHIRRDPATLVLMLAIPVLQIVLFGYAIDTDVRNIPTAFLDQDRRRASRELLDSFRNTDSFRFVGEAASERELRDAIVGGRAKVGIQVPPDFSKLLESGRPATVLVLIDGSDSSIAMNALNVSNAVGLRRSLERLLAPAGTGAPAMPMEVRPRMLFNPDLESSRFMIPGLIGIILQNVTVLLTAFAVVRERERGTLEQLLVTPIRPAALILGKLIPYAVVGLVETCLVLTIMRTVFGVEVAGSLPLLFLFTVLFLLPSLGLGLLISTIAANQAQAYQMAFFIILPSVLLSGFMFPRESMPLPMFVLSHVLPVTYYLNILRGIILRGAGFAHLWKDGAVLLGFAVLFLTASARRFHKQIG